MLIVESALAQSIYFCEGDMLTYSIDLWWNLTALDNSSDGNFHTFKKPSSPPLTAYWPSGDMHALQTSFSWPLTFATGLRSGMFHTRSWPSTPAVIIYRLSGEISSDCICFHVGVSIRYTVKIIPGMSDFQGLVRSVYYIIIIG